MGVPQNKVLVVDDDLESRSLLCEVLAGNGYAVQAVGDGLAAREVLSKDGEIRVVIADMQMPNETGLELLRKLREQKSPHAIILMSSFISAKQRKLAKDLGACALLDKPFRLTELLQVVADVAPNKALGISQ